MICLGNARRRGSTIKSLEEKYQDAAWRKQYYLFDMGWGEVQEWLERTDTVMFAAGSREQHGPHQGIKTSEWVADVMEKRDGTDVRVNVGPYQVSIPLDHTEFAEHGLGTLGDPVGATQEAGGITYGRCIDYVAEVIEKVKSLPVTVRDREWNARVL